MGVSWAFVVLLIYPALQVPMLWVIVRHFGLRNDDGPRNPVGYTVPGPRRGDGGDDSGADQPTTTAGESASDDHGRDRPLTLACDNCGRQNRPAARYCGGCLTRLR